MDHHSNHYLAAFNSILSLISSTFCVVTLGDIQPYVTFGGSCLAIVSAFFAIRYYYFATKKLKIKK
jgi:hypothetical protein